jgi:hypothetical protein
MHVSNYIIRVWCGIYSKYINMRVKFAQMHWHTCLCTYIHMYTLIHTHVLTPQSHTHSQLSARQDIVLFDAHAPDVCLHVRVCPPASVSDRYVCVVNMCMLCFCGVQGWKHCNTTLTCTRARTCIHTAMRAHSLFLSVHSYFCTLSHFLLYFHSFAVPNLLCCAR